jgi:tripartite-type tricarboxylate transporter receptor subunit TctC
MKENNSFDFFLFSDQFALPKLHEIKRNSACLSMEYVVHKRTFLRATAGAALSAGLGRYTLAASYPDRPITVVVALAPGGSADGLARLVTRGMSQGLGQPFVVDNRAGAGGSIGAAYVAKSKPDGYTLLYATSSHAVNMSLYKPQPFDLVKDFEPITVLARPPIVMVVNSHLPVSSVAEFIAWAKANGNASYGSAGNGSTAHLAAALFAEMASLKMQHIPFKGGAPANLELLAGRLDVVFAPMVEVLGYLESGKLKALGVTGTKRSPRMPKVPPIADTLPGYQVNLWHGLMAPAGTDPAITALLAREAQKSLQLPETRKQMAADGNEPVGSTPKQFAEMLPGDIAEWARLVKLSNAVIE